MLSLEFPFFFANVCLHIQYDFVMSDQNFILTFLVLALRVIARFSYDVVNRWNERWLGNITSATDHELWRCKGKKTVPFPIAFPSGSGRRALILYFPFFFDDWFRIPNFCQNTGLFAKTVSRAKTLANLSSRLAVNSRIPSKKFCLFPEFCTVFWSNSVSRKDSSRRKNGSLSHKTMQPGIKKSLL